MVERPQHPGAGGTGAGRNGAARPAAPRKDGQSWARSYRLAPGSPARVPLEPLPPGASHFEPLLTRALARDPEERFESATDMLSALRSLSASN